MTRGARRGGALLAALLGVVAACGTPPGRVQPPNAPLDRPSQPQVEVLSPESRPAPPSGGFARGRVLARVGTREFTSDDVVKQFFRTSRAEASASLNQMVVQTIVAAEAARLRLEVPPAWLALERAQASERAAAEARKAYGAGATATEFVQREDRQTLEAWLDARMVEARERWLMSRILRYHAVLADRVELQLLAVDDESRARELASQLDAGADMAVIATKWSVHPSASEGGRLPPLPRESLAKSVADKAFDLAPGQRSGILAVDDGTGVRRFEIIRVVRRIPGRDLPFSDVAAEIEAGLERNPMTDLEFTAWNIRLQRLYNVWIDDTL